MTSTYMTGLRSRKSLAVRRLLSVAVAVGILAASVTRVDAATGPTKQPRWSSQVPLVVTSPTSGLSINAAATGNCTQTVTPAASTITSAQAINYTAIVTNQQLLYFLCLNQYTVSDTSGTGSGWHLTFKASPWTCNPPAGVSQQCTKGTTMPAGSFYMDVPTVACAGGVSCTGRAAPPSIKMTTLTAIDVAAPVTIASAAPNTGMGSYTFTPRTDTCGTNDKCLDKSGNTVSGGQLGLYAPAKYKNGTYTSTLTETVSSGP